MSGNGGGYAGSPRSAPGASGSIIRSAAELHPHVVLQLADNPAPKLVTFAAENTTRRSAHRCSLSGVVTGQKPVVVFLASVVFRNSTVGSGAGAEAGLGRHGPGPICVRPPS